MTKGLLKTYFETGDIPTQLQFEELVEYADIGRSLSFLFLDEAVNLFNAEDFEDNKYLGTSDGAVLGHPTRGNTGKIYMRPNRTLLLSGFHPTFNQAHAYRKDGTWISLMPTTTVGANKQVVTPPETYYVAFNLFPSDADQTYVASFSVVDIKELLFKIKNLVQGKFFINEIDKPLLPNIIEPDTEPRELFNGHIDDTGRQSANGDLFQVAPWKITEKIYITVGETYTATGFSPRFDVHEFDIDGNWLQVNGSTSGNPIKTFTITDPLCNYIEVVIAQTVAHANVVNTLSITGVSPQSFRIKAEYLTAAAGGGGTAYDQELNTIDDVEFNSLSVEALSFNATPWDETGTAPIPIGQAYLFDNNTQYEVRVRKA